MFQKGPVGALILAALCTLGPPQQAQANAQDSLLAGICDQAAIRAARETGVPQDVLLAITRTETARYGTPWPWTVNMEGDGHWFDTEAEARAFAERRHAGGAESFDIGCFQINYRWHAEHFSSIEAMFDPDENARYAARFLIELYAEFEDWDRAVGAYHSRTERYAARYLRIYHGHLEGLGANPQMPPPRVAAGPPAVNGYPLLQTGAQGQMGSLVPERSGARPLIGPAP